jgi:hypothetical protein
MKCCDKHTKESYCKFVASEQYYAADYKFSKKISEIRKGKSKVGNSVGTSSVWLGTVSLHAGGLLDKQPLGVVPGPDRGGGGQEARGQAEAAQQAQHRPHLPQAPANGFQTLLKGTVRPVSLFLQGQSGQPDLA